jgi:hypothetical protein
VCLTEQLCTLLSDLCPVICFWAVTKSIPRGRQGRKNEYKEWEKSKFYIRYKTYNVLKHTHNKILEWKYKSPNIHHLFPDAIY